MSDVLEDQPREESLVVRPNTAGKYQCKKCPKSFACPDPYRHHASTHSDTIEHIYVEFKEPAVLKPEIRAFCGVYCDGDTHYVQISISQPFGPTSMIKEVVEDMIITFEDFFQRGFSSTEIYIDAVRRIEEFDRKCCRQIRDTTIFSPKTLVKWMRSCFSACIPTPRRSWSSRWTSTPDTRPTSLCPSTKAIAASYAQDRVADAANSTASRPSTPDTRPTSLYPSIEATNANNGQDMVADDPTSIARTVLPENLSGIIAVHSFYSTSNGVRGNVLVATQSDTVMLLQRVDLGALLLHTRCASQLRDIVGEYTYEQLLEFEEKRMDVLDPVYSGILPDDLPIGVGEEVPLEKCSPMLQAQVFNCLGV